MKCTSKHENQTFFFRNIIYIIGYKVANDINSSYYTTLINNNRKRRRRGVKVIRK